MSEFEKATDQVLAFPYRKQGPGGELPTAQVMVLPADRAERVAALDARIQKVRRAAPAILGSMACLGAILAAALDWMRPGMAAVCAAACLLQTIAAMGREAGRG